MKETEFLALMDAVGADYAAEAAAYRGSRAGDDPHRSIIFRITTVIAAAAVVLILTGTVVLLHSGGKPAVSKIAYPVGMYAEADAVKFTAEPSGAEHERSMRCEMQTRVQYGSENGWIVNTHMETLAHTDSGLFSIGVPDPGDPGAVNGLCYTDFETGKTVYLCAKPECLHDGSAFCNATTSAYDFCSLAYSGDMLYALATKHTGDAEHPFQAMLLACSPDGSGIREIAELSAFGAIEQCELIAHRGALWIYAKFICYEASADAVFDKNMLREHTQFALYHYDPQTRQLTWLTGSAADAESAGSDPITDLRGVGDYVYFTQNKNRNTALPAGICRADVRTGVIENLGVDTDGIFCYAVSEKNLYYTKRASDPSTETQGKWALHIRSLADGSETEVLVPHCTDILAEGDYVYIQLSDMLTDSRTMIKLNSDGSETYLWREGRGIEPDEELSLVRVQYGISGETFRTFYLGDWVQHNDTQLWFGNAVEITEQPLFDAFFPPWYSSTPEPEQKICTLWTAENAKTFSDTES